MVRTWNPRCATISPSPCWMTMPSRWPSPRLDFRPIGNIRSSPRKSAKRCRIGRLAVYLLDPAKLAQSAHTLKLTLGLLIVVLLLAIGVGGWLIVTDLNRQLTLARQKTDFVSNVSHELKTPLTSIRMFSELLAEGRVAEPEKRQSYLQHHHRRNLPPHAADQQRARFLAHGTRRKEIQLPVLRPCRAGARNRGNLPSAPGIQWFRIQSEVAGRRDHDQRRPRRARAGAGQPALQCRKIFQRRARKSPCKSSNCANRCPMSKCGSWIAAPACRAVARKKSSSNFIARTIP